jgi:ABC-2 type transport system ATP-binding protein
MAATAVAALAPMAEEAPTCDDGVVRLPVRGREGTIVAAVRRLDDAGVGVDDLTLRRPTLDDVFLTLTGRPAEEAATEAEAEADFETEQAA